MALIGRIIGQEQEVWNGFINWRIMRNVKDAAAMGTDQLREVIKHGRAAMLGFLHVILTEGTSLRLTERRAMGRHYAETLRLWRERFTARRDEVAALGFDTTFRRMWEFYLAYSEAGFRAGYLDVHQLVFTRDAPDRQARR